MDREYTKKLEEKCIQDCAPGCQSLCPLHVDVRGVSAAVGKGDFTAALELYMRSVPFPAILSALCDAPCADGCLRAELGGAVDAAGLETAAVRYGERRERKVKVLRKRSETVAVVGGGLSGLSASIWLADKGYRVHLYEKDARLGGRIHEHTGGLLSGELIETDLAVINRSSIEIFLSSPVVNGGFQDICGCYPAVLVAAGAIPCGSWAAGLTDQLSAEHETFQTAVPGVFAAGSFISDRWSAVHSISGGRRAAVSIDRMLQNVSLTAGREGEGVYRSSLYTGTAGTRPQPRVAAAGEFFTEAEARAEADRCLLCECMECVKACSLLESYESYPKRYVRELSNSVNQFYGVRKTKHMLNGCTGCGVCGEVCPNDLSMGEVCTAGRLELVERGIMPPAIHDFPIQDMLDACSDSCSITAGAQQPEYLYFPGCQMQALMPDLLLKSCRALQKVTGGSTAVRLGCCGAPAEWAGRLPLRDRIIADFESEWEALGCPMIIFACSSCRKTLACHFPADKLVSVWEIFDAAPDVFFSLSSQAAEGRFAVADSCSAKNLPDTRGAVRSLLHRLGAEVSELEFNGERARCCGFGGLVSHAEPDIGKKIGLARITESPLDYLVYCVMCREHFNAGGKRTFHLLELLFGASAYTPPPGGRTSWSRRQENRRRLREELRLEFSPALPRPETEAWEELKLFIGQEVREQMEERMILYRNLQLLVFDAEASGRKIKDPETGRYTAGSRPGVVTYWAEYSPEGGGFRVHGCYSHRLVIKD